MGLYFGRSVSKTAENYEEKKVSQFDPNPANFKVIDSFEANGHIVVLINYPNCNTFEGNKILVYLNTTLQQINEAKEIDPHFKSERGFSPFARFEPTLEGGIIARELIKHLKPKPKAK